MTDVASCADARQPSPAEFAQTGISTLPHLMPVTQELCDRHWHWFVIPTEAPRVDSRTERRVAADGVLRATEVARTVNETASMVVTVDGIWERTAGGELERE